MSDKQTAADREALGRVAHGEAVRYSEELGGGDTEPWDKLPEWWKEMWRRAAEAVAVSCREKVSA